VYGGTPVVLDCEDEFEDAYDKATTLNPLSASVVNIAPLRSPLEIELNPVTLWRGSGVCHLSPQANRDPPGINQSR
jgi:hypothetical protein